MRIIYIITNTTQQILYNPLTVTNKISIMINIIRYLCLLILMMCAGSLYSQTVSGKITDNENLPLPGASVMVKGTQNVVSSDMDGNFTIQDVSPGSVLQISFIGFISQSIEVTNSSVINVSLKPAANELEEIVVVGASVKRSDLTGAISSISGEKLKETPTPNVVAGLQGRLAGVYIQQNANPAGSAQIKIRGNNSIQYGQNSIFVVDGLVMEGNFENINPNDIANIDVLKDASATALYGSRGSGGVVVITTKKGSRSGEGRIEYETWVGVSEFSKKIPLMNAQQLFDLRTDAFANRYMELNPTANRQEYINQITADGSNVFAQYELDTYRSGKSYNWLDQVTRSGVQTNHNLSFSGGGEKGTYFVSFNYTDNQGLLKNSGFKRYNGKINLTQDVKKWLQIGTNTTFSRSEAKYQEGSAFGSALSANPLLPIDPTIKQLTYAQSGEGSPNPILSLDIINNSNRNMLTSTNFVSIKPVTGLDIRSTFGVNITDQANFDYIPSYTQQSIRNDLQGEGHHYRNSELNYQWDNTVSYNRIFSNKHDVSLLGGYYITKNTNNYTDARVRGFVSDDFNYINLGAASDRENSSIGSGFVTNTLQSFLGRANYVYDGKYAITGTMRYDGSSKFGINNKWGAFPSVSASWDIAKESWLENSEKINQLKLRAGYGISGNQNIPAGYYNSLYNPVIVSGTTVYLSNGILGNPNIQWEEQKQLNLGLDFAAFNNRLSINANYFNTDNDNLLILRSISTTIGYRQKLDNVGSMRNKGIEFSVNGSIIKNEDFTWDVSANISSAKNKITKLYGDVTEIYSTGGFTGNEIQATGNYFLGKSINSIYTYQFDKIVQESDMDEVNQLDLGGRTVQPGDVLIKDRNGDGKINDSDRYVVGNTDPNYYGGFNTNFTYKGIGINAVFAYSIGGRRISNIYSGFINSSGSSAAHTDLLDRWTPQNTDTDIPRAYSEGGRFSLNETDRSIQNASFLRLNALSLSYNLPADIAQRVYMKGVKIYITGSNLFTATKYKGYDPESGDSYPNSRMMVMGVNVSL